MSILSGRCFCGEVQFEVSGHPAAMGYCHCESCRHWSAGPVNAFSLWKPESLKITQGASNIGTYNKTPISYRKWCKKCGGHLFTEHPTMGLVDIYVALLPQLKFRARTARQLPGDCSAYQGWKTKNEGHAEGNGRVRRSAARMR